MVCDGSRASQDELTESAHGGWAVSHDLGPHGGLDAGATLSESPQRKQLCLVWSLWRRAQGMEEGGQLGGCGVISLGQWEEEKGLVWDPFWKHSPSREEADILWDSH